MWANWLSIHHSVCSVCVCVCKTKNCNSREFNQLQDWTHKPAHTNTHAFSNIPNYTKANGGITRLPPTGLTPAAVSRGRCIVFVWAAEAAGGSRLLIFLISSVLIRCTMLCLIRWNMMCGCALLTIGSSGCVGGDATLRLHRLFSTADSGSNCHQRKAAAHLSGLFWLNFCAVKVKVCDRLFSCQCLRGLGRFHT